MAKKNIVGVEIPYGIKSFNKMYSADSYAGPYDTIQDAMDTVEEAVRVIGRPVGIIRPDAKGVELYYFELDENDDWILVQGATGGSGGTPSLQEVIDESDGDSPILDGSSGDDGDVVGRNAAGKLVWMVAGTELTPDELAGIQNANGLDATNPVATINDIPAPTPSGVQSVTGDGVGGTAEDVVMTFPTPAEIGALTSIADKSITFPKIQDIPTNTILGRVAEGSGSVKALTKAEARTLIGFDDFTTQEITSGGNYNNLEVTADVLVFTNENAQAILNGVWGRKQFHILNRSSQYQVRINHNSSSVSGNGEPIMLPTANGSVGVLGTARVLKTDSYGYFVADTWGSTYRPEFKDITETKIVGVNDQSNAELFDTIDYEVYRDAQITPMSKNDLEAAYPYADRGFQVICEKIGKIYKKTKTSPVKWDEITLTEVL